MPEELPEFDFSDENQFCRLATHLLKLHRDAVEAKRQGKARRVYRLKLTRVRANRSTAANNYYWGVVLPHAAKGFQEAWGEEGFNSYDAHEYFKQRFLTQEVINRLFDGGKAALGEVMGTRPRRRDDGTPIDSTATMDTAEFAEYVNQCIVFAAEYLSVNVPPATRTYELKDLPELLHRLPNDLDKHWRNN